MKKVSVRIAKKKSRSGFFPAVFIDAGIFICVRRYTSTLAVSVIVFLSGCSFFSEDNVQGWGKRVLGLVPGYSLIESFAVGESSAAVRDDLTVEEEHFLGRAVAARILSIYPALEDQELDSYLNRVGAVAVAFSDRQETFTGYHFQVLDTADINSLAAPGGFIFITRGLLEIMPDEDVLAAVLSHEVSHVVERHGVKAIGQAHLNDLFSLGTKAASTLNCSELTSQLNFAFQGAVDDVFNFLEKGYSRDQEYEADSGAVTILMRSGYDPFALTTALDQLISAGEGQDSSWLSSHPATSERRARVVNQLKGIEPSSSGARALRMERFRNIMQGR